VHEEVEPSPPGLDLGEEIVQLGVVADVERFDEVRADRFRKRTDASQQRFPEVAESEFRPFAAASLRDPPRDRLVVGDAEDQTFPAFQDPHGLPSLQDQTQFYKIRGSVRSVFLVKLIIKKRPARGSKNRIPQAAV